MRWRSWTGFFGGLYVFAATSCAPLAFTFNEEGAGGASGGASSASSSVSGSGGAGGSGGSAPAAVCGDGAVTAPEACDDGNTTNGDACSSDCRCGDTSKAVAAVALPNGHCYVLLGLDLDWISGRDYCATHGWHLATVTTAEERDLISQAAAMVAVPQLWLGGTDADAEGTWTWADGAPWTINPCLAGAPGCDNTVNLWAPNEPNDMLNEDCLVLDTNVNVFNDGGCQVVMASLCERDPP